MVQVHFDVSHMHLMPRTALLSLPFSPIAQHSHPYESVGKLGVL
jgi:hypothetical protein